MPHFLPLFLLFSHFFCQSIGLTTCPKQCICQEHSIACSCEGAQKPELIISSLGSTYITSLVVHTCEKVTIQNGSFAGVVLVERLSFIAIDRLYFEPQAFKDILQSPRQVVIDECNIQSLAPVAFAGLSHIDHLWFRNSKIDVIAMEAFHYLTNIDYIYFHKTKIGRIERKAFSKMYQINHLYFKQSVEIDVIESEAFSNSQIDELIFDDVQISAAYDTFMLNTQASSAYINNSTVRLVPKNPQSQFFFDSDQQHLINRCRIKSSVFNTFSPATFGCDVTDFEDSDITILGVTTTDNQIVQAYENLRYQLKSLNFWNSSIGSWDPFGFSNYTMSRISVNKSSVGRIRQKSLSNVAVDSLIFEESKIEAFESYSFEKSRIKRMVWKSMDIGRIEKEAIYNSTIHDVEISNSKIEKVLGSIFKKSQIRKIHLDGSRVDSLDGIAFHGKNRIDSISITGNDLSTKSISIPFLSSHPSDHPTNFIFANNTIDCGSTHCSINSFLLNSPKHSPLEWQIANNKCRPPTTAPCTTPRIVTLDEHRITCRISWQVAECACIGPDAHLPFGYQMFGGDVSVVIIGDCERLTIGQPVVEFDDNLINPSISSHPFRGHSSISTISQLYIFRTTHCDLNQLPKSLRVLKLFHSHISFSGRLGNQPAAAGDPQFWHIAHSTVVHVERFAMADVVLSNLTITDSRLPRMVVSTTAGSRIQHLSIDGSFIESTSPLFQITKSLRMTNSVVFSTPRTLGQIRSAQLQNNTLLDCCPIYGFSANDPDPRCDLYFSGAVCSEDQRRVEHLAIRFSMDAFSGFLAFCHLLFLGLRY